MDDYIKRNDVMMVLGQSKTLVDGMRSVLMIPSAEAVEVVRCKDCKYWLPHEQFGFDEDNDEYHDYCGYHMPQDEFEAEYWDANDFCNHGKRKKNV